MVSVDVARLLLQAASEDHSIMQRFSGHGSEVSCETVRTHKRLNMCFLNLEVFATRFGCSFLEHANPRGFT